MANRLSIAPKLAILVGITFFIVGGGFLIAVHQIIEQNAIAEIKRGGIRLCDSLKHSFRHAMLVNDRNGIAGAIQSVTDHEEIEGLRITNKDGIIAFSHDPAEIHRKVDLNAVSCSPCHKNHHPSRYLTDYERTTIYTDADGNRNLLLISPIYNNPDCSTASCHVHSGDQRVLGVMDLSLSLASSDTRSNRTENRFIGFGIGILGVLTGVIVISIRRVVLKPIHQLIRGTEVIASGDLDYRIPIQSTDEVGRLAKSFNRMTETLQNTRNHLLQTERLASLGQLAAGIAHEINNPLTGIMMNASILKESLAGEETQYKPLDVILHESNRCKSIVKGLLDFSGNRKPCMKQTDLVALVQHTLQMLNSQFLASGITMDLQIRQTPPPFLMDPVQIQQVLVNLLINAMDAMPGGGCLTIVLNVWNHEMAEIVIMDSGHGIAPEDITRLFEPFYTTKGTQGTGLGLAIVWGIVEQHHGKISVESELHRGTTFTIRLPLTDRSPSS